MKAKITTLVLLGFLAFSGASHAFAYNISFTPTSPQVVQTNTVPDAGIGNGGFTLNWVAWKPDGSYAYNRIMGFGFTNPATQLDQVGTYHFGMCGIGGNTYGEPACGAISSTTWNAWSAANPSYAFAQTYTLTSLVTTTLTATDVGGNMVRPELSNLGTYGGAIIAVLLVIILGLILFKFGIKRVKKVVH